MSHYANVERVGMEGLANGFIESGGDGYEGEISVEGINLSPIVGVMFKQEGSVYLWLKRKDMLVYNANEQRYTSRKKEPRWEAYLKKQMMDNTVAFKGEFVFMRFRFSIVGVWDKVFGHSKKRINFFVDRLPMDKQNIIQGIRRRNNES